MKTILIAVVSLDGCLTKHDIPSATSWASKEDQAHFRSTSATCDVRVFGSATYEADGPGIRASLAPGIRRIVMTSRPNAYTSDVVEGQLEFTNETPASLISRLSSEGHKRCAVLGGGAVYGAFLDADLVDELQLTIEPVIFGSGIRLAGQAPIDARFELASIDKLAPSILLATYTRGASVS